MPEKVYIETYGCQMNEYDSDIVRSFLKQGDYALAASPQEARVILLNTCAIRENAHQRIYGRLDQFRRLKEKRPELLIGILGSFILACVIWDTLRIPNVQAATGFFYIAILTAMIGEFLGRYLWGVTAIPL